MYHTLESDNDDFKKPILTRTTISQIRTSHNDIKKKAILQNRYIQ